MKRIKATAAAAPACTAVSIAAVFAPSPVAAQTYPDRPIRVINAFAAGTASDIIPRFDLEKTATLLGPGASFIFENVPGAGGNSGTASAIRQDPDGYRISATAIGLLSVNEVLFDSLGYDPETDIEPAGLPGLITSSWFAFVAPKGTPKPIVDRLNGAIVAALEDPEIVKKLDDLGAAPLPMSPAEFKTFISDEVKRWQEIITKGNIQQL